jgi:hypothetical protein
MWGTFAQMLIVPVPQPHAPPSAILRDELDASGCWSSDGSRDQLQEEARRDQRKPQAQGALENDVCSRCAESERRDVYRPRESHDVALYFPALSI